MLTAASLGSLPWAGQSGPTLHPYYTEYTQFWATEAHVLLRYIEGIEANLKIYAGDLGKRRKQLESALNPCAAESALDAARK